MEAQWRLGLGSSPLQLICRDEFRDQHLGFLYDEFQQKKQVKAY